MNVFSKYELDLYGATFEVLKNKFNKNFFDLFDLLNKQNSLEWYLYISLLNFIKFQSRLEKMVSNQTALFDDFIKWSELNFDININSKQIESYILIKQLERNYLLTNEEFEEFQEIFTNIKQIFTLELKQSFANEYFNYLELKGEKELIFIDFIPEHGLKDTYWSLRIFKYLNLLENYNGRLIITGLDKELEIARSLIERQINKDIGFLNLKNLKQFLNSLIIKN